MYIPLVLAALPALSRATYLDPSLQHQKPLVEDAAPASSDNALLPLDVRLSSQRAYRRHRSP